MSATIEYDLNLCEEKLELVKLSNEENFVIDALPYASNRYEHSFHINSAYLDFLIGKNGWILNKLSKETNTLIRLHNLSSTALIIGEKENIITARKHINQIMEDSKEKLRKTQKTHLIVIPATFSNIQENYIKFKKNVLENCGTFAPGLTEGMFTEVERLHLTVGTMIIIEPEEMQKALETFDYCKREIVSPIMEQSGPIKVQFKGVKCMNEDPEKATVLYAEVHEETGYLQEIANKINDYVLQQGLGRFQKGRETVRLHLTLINVRIIKPHTVKFTRDVIYATNILNEYKDYDFGKTILTNIHFVEKGTTDKSGFYELVTTIELSNL